MTKKSKAYFAGGCFWCIEAVFKRLKGVISVTSGYAGGDVENPSYMQVEMNKTGHAQVVEVVFDEEVVNYETLLDVFFSVHDPTTLNRQGADIGEQYRSAIFYINQDQKKSAEEYIDKLEKEGIFDERIVTEVEPLDEFYKAEGYHQDYFEKNPDKAYCQVVIAPKIEILKNRYESLLKE